MAMKFGKLASAVALATLAIGSVQAKEGGDQYPNGAETWLGGAVPPFQLMFLGGLCGLVVVPMVLRSGGQWRDVVRPKRPGI